MSDVVDVVVIGGGVGGLTAAWELSRSGREVTLLEASDHLGGLVRPLDVGGLVVDRGGEAFALRRPAVAELCADLGLPTELPSHGSWLLTPERGAFPSPARAMLGIPADPSAPDVVAAVGQAAARRAAQDAELDPAVGSEAPDLATLVTARMGAGLLERLVRPLVTAIHGTDPSGLPVDGVMPGLRDALLHHGSLAAAVAATLPQGPAVGSVTGGMYRLADALAAAAHDAGARLCTGAPVAALETGSRGLWRVRVAGRTDALEAPDVVVATGGSATLALLTPHANTRGVRTQTGAPTAHVSLLLDAPELNDAPRGSGVITADDVPGPKALTHVTAKWAWAARTAGPGRHLIRLSYGRPGQGPSHPDPAEALQDAARPLGTDLRPGQLRASSVVHHPGALTPADPGARDAVLTIARRMGERGLHLAGGLVAGTGLPAIIARARSLAAHLAQPGHAPPSPATQPPARPRTSERPVMVIPDSLPRPWVLGTRGSDLARTQAGYVADALAAAGAGAGELRIVRTEGDVLTGSLAALGGAGVFAGALRAALADGTVDVVVHSLKDLPTAPAPGLQILAVPPRGDVHDALCARDGHTLTTLPPGARVGTGSPRRAAQLRAARPDLAVVDIRGNVPTRLARIEDDLEAVVLALAGLTRIGLADRATDILDPALMLPAPGQGALAVETRIEVPEPLATALAAVNDLPTVAAVTAERQLLARLEAGCAAPVGALGSLDGGTLTLEAVAVAIDGSRALRSARSTDLDLDAGSDEVISAARALGHDLGTELIGQGAGELARAAP